MIARYSKDSLPLYCDAIAAKDADLKNIIAGFGYPPFWVRPNTFATLVLIILEQQVSLAAAYAAFKKLEEKAGRITPETLLELTDAELRACYFSRQKAGYVRGLATAISAKQLDLESLYYQPDNVVRSVLRTFKGIGDWTIDVYLIHVLHRVDIFPTGDLALVKACKEVKQLPVAISKEGLLQLADAWRPWRTPATLLLWHYYIQKRGLRVYY